MTTAIGLILALVAIFAVALFARRRVDAAPRQPRKSSEPVFPRVPSLAPGEIYDTSAKLAIVPNAPMADLWCQRLREQGIEAFYKSGQFASLPGIYGGSAVNPGGPVELWVGEHDVERARQLFPELT